MLAPQDQPDAGQEDRANGDDSPRPRDAWGFLRAHHDGHDQHEPAEQPAQRLWRDASGQQTAEQSTEARYPASPVVDLIAMPTSEVTIASLDSMPAR